MVNFKSFTEASDYFPKTLELMRKLVPTHVVFRSKVGALTGKNALQAKVGETVLIVHSQANRDSRPHLIGGHGDYVWDTGKFHNPPEKDLETWFIRGEVREQLSTPSVSRAFTSTSITCLSKRWNLAHWRISRLKASGTMI